MIARIENIELPPGKRVLAISDVHGNLDYFKGLLELVGYRKDDILFLVGDLVEKGPESLKTLRYVMALARQREVHYICGNCDWWCPLLFGGIAGDEDIRRYYLIKRQCLVQQMCAPLGFPLTETTDIGELRSLLLDAYPEEWAFLKNLPEVIETPEYIFVHGGLPEGPRETWDAWSCMRYQRFRDCGRKFKKWVICGHYPVVLYGKDRVCANPIIDRDSRIVSIDGGCVLKDDGQLNALILPTHAGGDFSFAAYDPFPEAEVLDRQAPSEKSWYIRWGDAKVELLRWGEEFSLVRHIRTGYEMEILTAYLRRREGQGWVYTINDSTDYVLPLEPGDRVRIVERTSRGYFVKHRGVSGWYYGHLKES